MPRKMRFCGGVGLIADALLRNLSGPNFLTHFNNKLVSSTFQLVKITLLLEKVAKLICRPLRGV